ncbi:MAG: hypothetical protein OEV42_07205 [Deltaproteobacteria bacterium]|nr:hypothetical protein [Deltaproteobacteria bacterium]
MDRKVNKVSGTTNNRFLYVLTCNYPFMAGFKKQQRIALYCHFTVLPHLSSPKKFLFNFKIKKPYHRR